MAELHRIPKKQLDIDIFSVSDDMSRIVDLDHTTAEVKSAVELQHNAVVCPSGSGLSVDGDQVMDNLDKGSDAVSLHETTYDHSLIGDAIKIQGRNVSANAPIDGEMIVWDAYSSEWKPGTPPGGGDMLKSIYDIMDVGIVDNAANVSDGVNVSAAVDVKDAVDKKHDRLHDFSGASDHNPITGNVDELVSLDGSGYPQSTGATITTTVTYPGVDTKVPTEKAVAKAAFEDATPDGYWHGITIRNNVASPNTQLDISTGLTVAADDGLGMIKLTSPVTLNSLSSGVNGFDLLASSAAQYRSRTGSTVTLWTTGSHGLALNQRIVVSGVGGTGYNGTWIVASTPASNRLTYVAAGPSEPQTACTGTIEGTVIISTWYYIWIIKNLTSLDVASLLSASSSVPTLPSGYTKKRLVGAAKVDSSANFLAFRQKDEKVQYVSSKEVVSTSATPTTFTAASAATYVPAGLGRTAQLTGTLTDSHNNEDSMLAIGHYDLLGSAYDNGTYLCRIKAEQPSGSGRCAGSAEVMLDSSARFSYAGGTSSGHTITIAVVSYEMSL